MIDWRVPVPVAAEAKKGDAQSTGVTGAKEDHDWVLENSEDPAVTELVSDGLAIYPGLLAALQVNQPAFRRLKPFMPILEH